MINLYKQLDDLKAKNFNYLNFKIDVGTSIYAPHTAHWLLHDNAVSVLGIEPNRENVELLRNGPVNTTIPCIRTESGHIYDNGKFQASVAASRYHILERCAIDNITEPTKAGFFCTNSVNTGCSSLLKPTEKLSELGVDVSRVDTVYVLSLENILEYIEFPLCARIMFVKTDTQGKDFDVVKSLGRYLSRVVAFKCEYNTRGQYDHANNGRDFMKFMCDNGFGLVRYDDSDFYFVNLSFSAPKLFDLPPD